MSSALAHQADRTSSRGDFRITIEPGHEEIWLTIRDLPRIFTAAELAGAAGAPTGKVELYLARLVRHGIATEEGKTVSNHIVYRVNRLPMAPLVLDDRGQPSRDYQTRYALWTAIRRLKTFTAAELYGLVEQHIHLTRGMVREFVRRLEAAGYIAPLDGVGRDGEPEWQLRRSMDTGPLPPRFCEVTLAYDINTRAFFGTALAKEVRL